MAAAVGPFGPLCLCGIRGCGLRDVHTRAFVVDTQHRRRRKTRRR